MPPDRDLLRRCGEALFGPRYWQAQLRRSLGVPQRTFARYASGERSPPAEMWGRIGALLAERKEQVAEATRQIDGSAGQVRR